MRVDGDGQHDPRELDRVLEPVLEGEADIAVGSRFAAPSNGYRSSRSRRLSIRLLAWTVSALVRQRVADTTSGFQAVNRLGIRLFAADYPRLSGGRGDGASVQAPAPAPGGPGVDARPRGGRSSITAVHSVYYMVKVLLAIFVAIFRRNAVPLEEDTR